MVNVWTLNKVLDASMEANKQHKSKSNTRPQREDAVLMNCWANNDNANNQTHKLNRSQSEARHIVVQTQQTQQSTVVADTLQHKHLQAVLPKAQRSTLPHHAQRHVWCVQQVALLQHESATKMRSQHTSRNHFPRTLAFGRGMKKLTSASWVKRMWQRDRFESFCERTFLWSKDKEPKLNKWFCLTKGKVYLGLQKEREK